MLPWAFNPQLLVDDVLNFVRILMVVAGAPMALLLLVSLMFAVATAVREGVSPSRTAPR